MNGGRFVLPARPRRSRRAASTVRPAPGGASRKEGSGSKGEGCHRLHWAAGQVSLAVRSGCNLPDRAPVSQSLQRHREPAGSLVVAAAAPGGWARRFGSVVLVADQAIGQGAEYRTENRRDPEQPQLGNRPVADVQGDRGAARRVHRGVGDRDADQVDQGQGQADGDRREACGARLEVAPRMISRNMPVSTTSLTSAACNE